MEEANNKKSVDDLDESLIEDEAMVVSEPSSSRRVLGHWDRLKNWYGGHKKWSIPLSFLIVLVVAVAVPWSRYAALSLFLKKDYTVQVMDSTAHTPVSGAIVTIAAVSSRTDGSGRATLHGVKLGDQQVNITKKYYQAKFSKVSVGILKQKNPTIITLLATGRQVQVNVINSITNKPLANVELTVAGTTAKTDSLGDTLLVLPAESTDQKTSLKLDGYNDATVTIKASSTAVIQNNFKLTPAGKIYYLSNSSGSLNIMKANLDGSDIQVAIESTGSEDPANSSILESGDGKFVALVAKRSPSDPTPQLYVISTADDKLLQVDTGNAAFQMYDWVGDTLVYTLQRQDLPLWQQGTNKIKAYDASSGSTTLLDQSAGSDAATNANEYYSEVMVSGQSVVYGKLWQGSGALTSKQNSLQVIGINGQNHQVIASYSTANNVYFSQHSPNALYVWQHDAGNNADTYLQYVVGGSIKQISISNDQFYQGQYRFIYSPSGQQTLWSELRDGKQTPIIADNTGSNTMIVPAASGYNAYGWISDQYILLSKNSNELYITGVRGGQPHFVVNYLSSGYNY